MQFLNKLSRKNMVKAVLCGVIAAGCVVGMVSDASADGWISADAQKIFADKGSYIWVAGKDKISVSNTQQAGYQAYEAGTVTGGMTDKAVISGKTVEVTGVTIDGDVYGGLTSVKIEKNNITIKDAIITGDVCGGQSEEGVASENNVKITNTSVVQGVVGGYSEYKAAKGNNVTIVGGSIGNENSVAYVYGGQGASANSNSVSITGTTLTSKVCGGFSDSGSASENKVTLTDIIFNSILGGTICGGYTQCGSDNKKIKTDSNTVNINITKSNKTINSVYGGQGIASAQNNKVFVTSNGTGEIANIYGGYAGEQGNASSNLVVLKGITVANVEGGNGIATTTTNNNAVVIADSNVEGNLVGGNGGISEDNKIVLVGKGGSYSLKSQDGKYQDIVNGMKASSVGTIYGFIINNSSNTGNSLAVYGEDTTVSNIVNIQKLEFTLKTGDNKDKNMLCINADANADTVLKNFESITVTAAPGANLAKDAKVNLIHKTDSGALKLLAGAEDSTSIFDEDGKVKPDYANVVVVSSPLKATSGELSMDKLDSDNNMNDLIYIAKENITVSNNGGGSAINELENNVKSTVETRANASALLNEGADFFLEQGFIQAKAAAKASAINGKAEFAPFVAIGGGNMRYETGSHVDSNSWHGAIGVSKQVGDLVYGVAVEHGKSNYDSYVDDAHGEGKSKSTGSAVFAEIKKNNGVHYDAALRAGRIKSDYTADLSLMGIGANVNYKESSAYYGLSLGAGKEVKLNDKDVVDFYGRYYWTHTNSADIATNLGDKINFDAVNSHRTRLGTRYTHTVNDVSKLYVGFAWQYEFSCKAKATVNGFEAPAPGLKGHSGMLELGYRVEAAKNMAIDLNVSGWAGKQRGIIGGVDFNWKF